MTESGKIRLIRWTSAVLLVAVTAALMICECKMRMRAIETTNPELSYLYSDMEMDPVGMPQDNETDVFVKLGLFDKKYDIDVGFVEFCAKDERINPDGTFLVSFKSRLDAMRYDDEVWADLTGYTFSVLYDIYTGAAYGGGVSVIGDVFDQDKTTVAVLGADTASGELAEMIGAADVTFAGAETPTYYISGGLKFAFCTDAGAVADAKAVSDIVIAEAQTYADAPAFVDAGADFVFTRSGETCVEYVGDCVAVYGFDGSVFVTVTLAVGIDPIVRIYPCVTADGTAVLADETTAKSVIDALNSRSLSAKIDENGRVRYK